MMPNARRLLPLITSMLVLSATLIGQERRQGGPQAIFVGPAEWISKQNFAFTKGASAQAVGMTGFRYNGQAAVTARTVKVGTRTLTARDATGTPMWDAQKSSQR